MFKLRIGKDKQISKNVFPTSKCSLSNNSEEPTRLRALFQKGNPSKTRIETTSTRQIFAFVSRKGYLQILPSYEVWNPDHQSLRKISERTFR
jgi:hypothetical protein